MKQYMVIYKTDEGVTGAAFYDICSEACTAKMDMECGMGWYCEIYERVDHGEEGRYYEFLEA